MKKNNFVTHVLSLGGKKARTTRKSVPFIGEILPSYKRNVTMSRKGFRAKTHRGGVNYFQGDRIEKGSWSQKRWATARRRDSARNGSKYEHWERKHGKPHTYNKRTSWK
jgi:hypothetical protein